MMMMMMAFLRFNIMHSIYMTLTVNLNYGHHVCTKSIKPNIMINRAVKEMFIAICSILIIIQTKI